MFSREITLLYDVIFINLAFYPHTHTHTHIYMYVCIQYCSKVSWQSVASLDSRLNSRFSIPARIEYRESRTFHRESRTFHWESRTCYRESRTLKRVSQVWKKRFSHDWFLDNFTLSEQNGPQAATPVLRERIYASKWEKSKLIGEKCVLKYVL